MHQTLRRHGATIVAALSIVVAPVPAAAQYQAYRLGVGVQFFGYQGGMNALGWVAANVQVGLNWTPIAINPISGQSISLDLLPGGSTASAMAINDARQVVGAGNAMGTGNLPRAIRWNADGSATALSTPPAGTYARANAINNAGTIVGDGNVAPAGEQRALRWDGNMVATLPAANSRTAAAVNDNGQAAGSVRISGVGVRAARWSEDGSVSELGLVSGATVSDAYGINASGQTVGFVNVQSCFITCTNRRRATMWDAGTGVATVLTFQYTYAEAFGINNAGTVVGTGFPGWGLSEAFLWNPVNGSVRLDQYVGLTASWTFSQARSINDRGDILAFGRALDTSSPYEGWVVLHDPSRVATVPEPAVLSLLAIGLSLILAIGSRRRRMAMESDEA